MGWRWRDAVLIGVVLVLGCDRDPPVEDCDDSLAGVWVGDGQRLHVLDHGPRLEIYSMDPAPQLAGPVRQSPAAFELARVPAGITGRRYLRRDRDGRVCHVDLPAEVRACGAGRITLAWRELVHVRQVDCKVTASPRWTELVLARERYTPARR